MKTLFILISLFFAVSLSARQRDSRVREYLPPARIVWQQESQLIQGANHLLLSGNGQSNLVNITSVSFRAPTGSILPSFLILEKNCKAACK